MNPIIEIRDIKVIRGGVEVLDIPNLTIQEGQIVSVIGPNGSSKSTLLLTLACLLPRFQGDIFFKGKPLCSKEDQFQYRRKMAMVFQEPLLFDTTVFKNVASGLKIRGVNRKMIPDKVNYYLNQLGITHLSNRSARKLSGGEAKRTSLARAFALEPEILFLDEPFTALDPPTHDMLIHDLKRILGETQKTAIMATHDLLEAIRISHHIVVMNQGKVIQQGTPQTIVDHPANTFVSDFMNRFFQAYRDLGLMKENKLINIISNF
ncbi:MAG: ABC transporter ATP-binding protein [Desulfobacterales bacterium]|nr:ABC transporter ATP-binding protein [Desulfobacterales bacterium]